MKIKTLSLAIIILTPICQIYANQKPILYLKWVKDHDCGLQSFFSKINADL